MRSSASITAIALGLALAGCSQSTGIAQVDRARDTMSTALGIGPELHPVGDAADHAARSAEAAGRTGDAKGIATAVGRGTVEVVCAGVSMRKPAAQQGARTFDARVPEIDGRRRAMDTYRAAVDVMPDMPSPCS